LLAQGQQGPDETRIEALEQKLQALVEEVRGLRTRTSIPSVIAPHVQGVHGLVPGRQPQVPSTKGATIKSDVQTLTRATYRLPQPKAEALANFLRDHMKASIEARIEGENLIVTASPQAQAAIEQFIALSEGVVPDYQASNYRYAVPVQGQSWFGRKPGKAPSKTKAEEPAPVEEKK
jgi:hypothetical protein